jgi:hypothetical protein
MQFLCNCYAIPMPMQFQRNSNAIQCNPMQFNAIQCNSMQSMQFQDLFPVAVRRGSSQRCKVCCSSRFVAAFQCNPVELNSSVCFSLRFVAVRRSVSCNTMRFLGLFPVAVRRGSSQRCNSMQFNAIQCNPMQSNAIRCISNAFPMQSNAIQRISNGIQCNFMPKNDVRSHLTSHFTPKNDVRR